MTNKDAVWLISRLRQEFPALFDCENDEDVSGGDLVDFLAYQIHELQKSAPEAEVVEDE